MTDCLSILRTQFDDLLLKGFRKGVFSEDTTKFVAYTLLSVEDEDYETLFFNHLKNAGCGYTMTHPPDVYRNYLDENRYSSKPPEQLVSEGIFTYVSTVFQGILFEHKWFVQKHFVYYDEGQNESEQRASENLAPKNIFDMETFQPMPRIKMQTDPATATEFINKRFGKHLDWPKDYEAISDLIAQLPKNDIPQRPVEQPVQYWEFENQPHLVVYLKQEQKSKINWAFNRYMNEAVFHPFAQYLKTEWPEHFETLYGMYGPDYPLVYPNSKEYVMAIFKAIDQKKSSRLYYFLYQPATYKMWEWTKPEVRPVPGHHDFYVIEDIKDLSTWGGRYLLNEPSLTMDEPGFWKEHVFAEKEGLYLYLKEWYVPNIVRGIFNNIRITS